MNTQSENPQYDDRQFDAEHGGAYAAGYDADPNAQGDGPYAAGYDADPNAQGDGPYADEPSGPPYRAIAMVLLSAVVLAIGVGLVQLFGGDDDEGVSAVEESTSQVEQNGQNGQGAEGQGAAGQGSDGQPAPGDGEPLPPGADQEPAAPADPASGENGQQGQAPDAGAPAATAVPVQIYNNSTVTGLAGRTGEQLRESGFAVGDVANMPSNRGVVAESTAFYGTGPGEQQAAQAIAGQLGISAKPRPADMAADAPGVIVIVTKDLDR